MSWRRDRIEILDYFARPISCYVGADEPFVEILEGEEDPEQAFWAYKYASRLRFAVSCPARLKQLIDAERHLKVDLLRWRHLSIELQMELMRVLPMNVWNFVRAELAYG